jgi:hypothetical protein
VSEHDQLETAYYQFRERSAITRWRMDLRDSADPFDASTERQLLVAISVAAALVVWRMEAYR